MKIKIGLGHYIKVKTSNQGDVVGIMKNISKIKHDNSYFGKYIFTMIRPDGDKFVFTDKSKITKISEQEYLAHAL